MPYETLYRRARPMTFDEVKGQEIIVRSLRNQIRKNRIGHAYLFSGVRGTGKTSVARIFARAVNCENPQDGNPCNQCPTCRAILQGTSNNVIEIDAAANGRIENIRDIESLIVRKPVRGRFFTFIIDETQEMKPGAVNAFLKTLEEPPSWVVFILATTSLRNMPQTILSRCQEYDFRRIGSGDIEEQMRMLLAKDGIAAEEKALSYIARKAEGSMRDALSILDRAVAFCGEGTLTCEKVMSASGEADVSRYAETAEALLRGDAGRAVRIFGEILLSGAGAEQFRMELLRYLRGLLLGDDDAEDDASGAGDNEPTGAADNAPAGAAEIRLLIGCLSDGFRLAQESVTDRVLTETALIEAAGLAKRAGKERALAERLDRIEGRLEALKSTESGQR